jgi:hypothetical protein
MAFRSRQSRQSIDPHGYQPLVIDEDCLSEADRVEAFVGWTAHDRDYLNYLTRTEIREFQTQIKDIEQSRSPYWIGPAELPAVQEKKSEMARLGMLRAYARDKYASGRRVWHGDGVPFSRESR